MSKTHQLERDALGRLVFIDSNGERHVGVHPVRAFPITAPGCWYWHHESVR